MAETRKMRGFPGSCSLPSASARTTGTPGTGSNIILGCSTGSSTGTPSGTVFRKAVRKASFGKTLYGMKRGCRLGSVLLVLFIFQMLLSSCSEEPPEILSSDHRIRLVYQPVSGLVQVFLALHLELKGEAAAEAVEQWNVTTDNGNLQWLLGADDLSVMVIDDRTWVGTNTLAMPSKFPLPSGTYRVEIADRRGGADAIEISVPRPDLYSSLLSNPSGRFPSITRDAGNRLVLRSGGLGKVMVRGFDQEGRSLGGFVPETAVLAQNSADWQTIGSYSRTELFVIDPLTGVELVTVIDRLPPERMPE